MANKSANWFERLLAKTDYDGKLSPLGESFFNRHTLDVARDLVGCVFICRYSNQKSVGVRIVETEAYRAGDEASHSAKGRTPRSEVMFGPPGRAYVYLIYGMYEMLNFVTEAVDHPGAVLVRGVEPLWGEEQIRSRRAKVARRLWTSGPGRLTRALDVRMEDNGASLLGPRFFVAKEKTSLKHSLWESPRVGISQAVEQPWRFFWKGNEFVSRVKENQKARLVK